MMCWGVDYVPGYAPRSGILVGLSADESNACFDRL
jgi:hypothetical protein